MKNTIELAVDSIAGFETIRYKLERSLINNGKSRRTYQAYAHRVASRCLHFNRLPETYFKFIVYGLRSGKGNTRPLCSIPDGLSALFLFKLHRKKIIAH